MMARHWLGSTPMKTFLAGHVRSDGWERPRLSRRRETDPVLTDRRSPTSAENRALERRIHRIRWMGIILCLLVAPLLSSGDRLLGIYVALIIAATLNLAFGRLASVGRGGRLLAAYAYGIFDVALGTVIIALSGGASSPFVLGYFPVAVHAAIRFGRRVALLISVAAAAGYLAAAALGSSTPPHYATVLLTVGFVTLTAVFAGLLSDRAHADELALGRQLTQARTLNQAGSALTGSLDWSVAVRQVVEQGRVLADADAAILDLRTTKPGDDGGDQFAARERVTDAATAGAYLAKAVLNSDLLAQLPTPDHDLISNIQLGERSSPTETMRQLPQGVMLRAPLLVKDRWVGDLLLLRGAPSLPYTEVETGVVRAFANQAALALENAWLYAWAREQATTDSITGLPNHRALNERLDGELARARRQGRPLCVLMLDIDHFKAYNDSFGHAAGDQALRAVAATLHHSLRRGDYCARYAGEEFVIILPDMDAVAGSALAERVRAAVAGIARDGYHELPGPLTASVGIAAFPEHGQDRNALLQAADHAMYLAKHVGRNRVCVAGEFGTVRGLEALVSQLARQLTLPGSSYAPELAADLERRFARLAAVRASSPRAQAASGQHGSSGDKSTVQAVTALAAAIDAKDRYTEGHSRHVSALAVMLAKAYGCTPDEIDAVQTGGLLHDIGKIAIPEDILNKAGPLTDGEWALMRSHTDVGARILAPISALRDVVPVVLHHHERWDGLGYPRRLSGEDIPLGARIVAVCDAYDTMVSDRPYRGGLGRREAVARLEAAAGTQFDPCLVPLFARLPLPEGKELPANTDPMAEPIDALARG